jgi:hypothetical protein
LRFHAVERYLLEVIKHADLDCMDEVRLREDVDDSGDMSKYVEFSVNIAR